MHIVLIIIPQLVHERFSGRVYCAPRYVQGVPLPDFTTVFPTGFCLSTEKYFA